MDSLLEEYKAGRLPVTELIAQVQHQNTLNKGIRTSCIITLWLACTNVAKSSMSGSSSGSSSCSIVACATLVASWHKQQALYSWPVSLSCAAAVQDGYRCSVSAEPLMEAVSASEAAAAAPNRPPWCQTSSTTAADKRCSRGPRGVCGRTAPVAVRGEV